MQRENSPISADSSQSSVGETGRAAFHGGLGNYCLGGIGADDNKAVVAPQKISEPDPKSGQE